MSKTKSVFRCTECGYEAHKWLGRCPDCGTWGSLTEERSSGRGTQGRWGQVTAEGAGAAQVTELSQVSTDASIRISTGIAGFDSALGGGAVPGSLILLGGEPGIGKSTLLLQALAGMASGPSGDPPDRPLMLVSGEESAGQVKLRAERLGSPGSLLILAETDLLAVEEAIARHAPIAAVIDSVQTLFNPELSSVPGSVSQVREAAARLMRLAKSLGSILFIVGHVTKDGSIAGPRVLEHMVDTVLYFEGDLHHNHRILRSTKNRFGPAGEMAVFAMEGQGLREVLSPSELFLSSRAGGTGVPGYSPPGSAVAATSDGGRAFLAEVQSLVCPAAGPARRVAQGLEGSRLSLLVAVLQQRGGVMLDSDDIYVSVTGGLRLSDPGSDLATLLAVYSAKRELHLPADCAAVGEIGLSGEIRPVAGLGRRVDEAARLGFTRILVPASALESAESVSPDSIEVVPVPDLAAALAWALDESHP